MRKIKHLLFILPLLFTLSAINSVKAIEGASLATVSTATFSPGHIDFGGTHKYYFYLDGVLALCANRGYAMRSGITMEATISSVVTSEITKKAYLYAYDHQTSPDIAAAQYVIWNGSTNGLCTALASFNVTQAWCDNVASAINGYRSDTEIYSWSYHGGGVAGKTYQNLITGKAPKDPPPENKCVDTCNLQEAADLPTCSSAVQNSGIVREAPYGYCENRYRCASQKYNISGIKEKAPNGNDACAKFCLQHIDLTYPGKILTAVSVGSYIVWPNNEDSRASKINNTLIKYPFFTHMNKTCHMYILETKIDEYEEYITEMRKYEKVVHKKASGHDSDKFSKTSIRIDIKSKVYPILRQGPHVTEATACADYSKDKKAADERVRQLKPTDDGYHDCLKYNEGCEKTGCEPKECSGEKEHIEFHKAVIWAGNAAERVDACNKYVKYYNNARDLLRKFNSCLHPQMEKTSYNITYQVSYEDPEYGSEGNFDIIEKPISDTCTHCGSEKIAEVNYFSNDKENPDPDKIEKTDVVDFSDAIKIPELKQDIDKKYYLFDDEINTYYYYTNKLNNKAMRSTTLATNFSKVEYSNLPISHNYTNFSKQYELRLSANAASITSSIGDKLAALITNNPYVCYYKVTTEPTNNCVCPEDSDHAGKTLDCKIGNNDQTCADAIIDYCYDSGTDIPQDCPPVTCPNGASNEGVMACISAGGTSSYCLAHYCKTWTCPVDMPGAGKSMTSCVTNKMMKEGLTEAQAKNYCIDVECTIKGVNIIYRIIDLDNPFPSYDAGKHTDKVFNDNVKGRYPGANWNGEKVVNRKILYNRSQGNSTTTDGEEVYSRTPLYTFVLDSQKIKAIRSYNSKIKEGYADFNLKCMRGNAACKSNFVHSAVSGLTSGTCSSSTNSASRFYSCVYD